MRFLLAIVLLAGCQDRAVEPERMKIAWDPDDGAVILTDGIAPDALAATAPGTLWLIYDYGEDLPLFTCRHIGGWQGLVEVRMTADSVYHPPNAKRYEENCMVQWSNRLRLGGVYPTDGRVRLESVNVVLPGNTDI